MQSTLFVLPSINSVPQIKLPPGFSIRNFVPNQNDELLWAQIETAAGEFNDVETASSLLDVWSNELPGELPSRCFFLVDESTGREIGTVTAWEGSGDLEGMGKIQCVSIIPQYQGRGLAKPLVSHALEYLKGKYTSAFVLTASEKVTTQRICADLGFNRVGEHETQSLADVVIGDDEVLIDLTEQEEHAREELPAILWDLNGVIIDDEPVHEQAFRDALKHVVGCDLTHQEYERYFFGKTDRQGVIDFGLGKLEMGVIDERTVEHVCVLKNEFYGQKASSEMRIFADAKALLIELHEHGYKQYIVTGSHRAEVEIGLLLLPDVFSGSITSSDYEESKPAPDPFLAGAALAGRSPSECVVFEDSVAGIRSAKNAGCVAIGIDNGFQTSYQTEMLRENADAKMRLSELSHQKVLALYNAFRNFTDDRSADDFFTRGDRAFLSGFGFE